MPFYKILIKSKRLAIDGCAWTVGKVADVLEFFYEHVRDFQYTLEHWARKIGR